MTLSKMISRAIVPFICILFILAAMLILSGCGQNIAPGLTNSPHGPGGPPPHPPGPPSPPSPDPDPAPAPDPIEWPRTIILYNATGAMLSNGTVFDPLPLDAPIMPAGNGYVASGSALYLVNSTGGHLEVATLPAMPAHLIINPANTWVFETISPAAAWANGASYKEYTRIWLDGAEHGNWKSRPWRSQNAVQTLSGHVAATDGVGAIHTIPAVLNAAYAGSDGLLIYDFDAPGRTALISTDTGAWSVSWWTNSFNGANAWQFYAMAWHSWNGYRWIEGQPLEENATALTAFQNPTYPVVIDAGVHNGTGYWIEANTGGLWAHDGLFDTLWQVATLYAADGSRSTGLIHAAELQPVVIQDLLLYNVAGDVLAYHFINGITNTLAKGMKGAAL